MKSFSCRECAEHLAGCPDFAAQAMAFRAVQRQATLLPGLYDNPAERADVIDHLVDAFGLVHWFGAISALGNASGHGSTLPQMGRLSKLHHRLLFALTPGSGGFTQVNAVVRSGCLALRAVEQQIEWVEVSDRNQGVPI